MTTEIKPKSNKGGPRPGSGRKKGSTNRYSSRDLIQSLSRVANGKEYVDQLAEAYWQAHLSDDKKLEFQFHHLITQKLFAEKLEVEIDDTSTVENRQIAFLKALETIGNTVLNHAATVAPTLAQPVEQYRLPPGDDSGD